MTMHNYKHTVRRTCLYKCFAIFANSAILHKKTTLWLNNALSLGISTNTHEVMPFRSAYTLLANHAKLHFLHFSVVRGSYFRLHLLFLVYFINIYIINSIYLTNIYDDIYFMVKSDFTYIFIQWFGLIAAQKVASWLPVRGCLWTIFL